MARGSYAIVQGSGAIAWVTTAPFEIRDGERVVLVLEIGHRRDIYEN